MTANESTSSHLRPLLSMKKYPIAEDLATSVVILVDHQKQRMIGGAYSGDGELRRHWSQCVYPLTGNS